MKRLSLASVGVAVAAALLLVLTVGVVVVWHSSRVLHSATEDVRVEREIRFMVRPLPQLTNSDFEVISSPAVFFQAARFQDHLYIAGPAGLLEYTPEGALLHQYAVGRELPDSPLIALATGVLTDAHEPELVSPPPTMVSSPSTAVRFAKFCLLDRRCRAITAILPRPSGPSSVWNQEARRVDL